MDLRSWLIAAGLQGTKLESTLKKCLLGDIETVADLRELAAAPEIFKDLFPPGLVQLKIKNALAKDTESDNQDNEPTTMPALVTTVPELPEGKRYPFFASHKKSHTRFGDASADLARALKDIIKLKANLEGYFDADNLQNISKEQLSLGIVQSCSVLLFLNDETLDSAWCRHEVDEARAYGIPIICVVDTDKQTQREVLDRYMERGFGWLFDSQVISYNSQGRDHAIDLIISAIRRAIDFCHSHDTFTSTTIEEKEATPEDKQEKPDVHESDATDTDELELQLKEAVISVFGSAKAAFDAHSKNSSLGKREWKKIVKQVFPSLKQDQAKRLRKIVKNQVSSLDFCAFIGEDTGSRVDKAKASSKKEQSSGLATLPPEVPELPPSFRPRLHAQEQLLTALLAREGARSTAVTAPKSRISSQGMGGVGKTMLTAAVVRDERLRVGFKTICWLNLSQQPEIMQLQRRLYGQLSDNADMPQPATKQVDSQIQELRKVAAKRLVLVVLDDMWDGEHERPFSCIDPATSSKLLVTTRIKGIMPRGLEVELELLGLRESVELLAAVAEIDADQTPPCCLEIAQCCGRLPLCLNIVGNLIRTFGSGWEDEIPGILKKDMKSLSTGKGDTSQPLNLQQRVIQSGLDSLEGEDAADIVVLFKGMAVFAEDQIVPVAILSVLWVSIDPKEHKPLSAMKVRQWVSQLLSRSIILGSASDGVSMHDIVRDFTLASQAGSALQQLQRAFVSTIVTLTDTANDTVATYANEQLALHVRGAVTVPLNEDPSVKGWLLDISNVNIVDQVVQGLQSSDVVELAHWLEETQDDLWCAARLYTVLGMRSREPPQQKAGYYLSCVQCCRRLKLDVQGQLDLEARARLKLVGMGNGVMTQGDMDEHVEWLNDVLNDTSKFSLISHLVKLSVMTQVSMVLIGYCPGKLSLNPSLEQLRLRAVNTIRSLIPRSIKTDAMSGFAFWHNRGASFFSYSQFTVCYFSSELNDEATALQMLGVDGEKLLAHHACYSFAAYHARGTARLQDFMWICFPSLLVFERFADIAKTQTFAEEWITLNQLVKEAGLASIRVSSLHWSRVPLPLFALLNIWGLGMRNIPAFVQGLHAHQWGWTYKDVHCFSNPATVLNLQCVAMARTPGCCQEAQAVALLPEPDCATFDDRGFLCTPGKTPLLLSAGIALNMRMRKQARRFLQKALLQIVCGPVRLQCSRAALGMLLGQEFL